MKHAYFVLLLLFSINSFSQSDSIIFKKSIIEDGFFCQAAYSIEKYCDCIEMVLNRKINQSIILKGQVQTPLKKQGRLMFYTIEMYEMKVIDYHWIMLRFESMKSSSYYRIKGYKENDFIHFYENVLKLLFVDNKKIAQQIKLWQEKEEEFKQIDFECLLKAARNNKLESSCLISNYYISKREGVVVSTDNISREKTIKKHLYDRVYSKFSNRPYLGWLPE